MAEKQQQPSTSREPRVSSHFRKSLPARCLTAHFQEALKSLPQPPTSKWERNGTLTLRTSATHNLHHFYADCDPANHLPLRKNRYRKSMPAPITPADLKLILPNVQSRAALRSSRVSARGQESSSTFTSDPDLHIRRRAAQTTTAKVPAVESKCLPSEEPMKVSARARKTCTHLPRRSPRKSPRRSPRPRQPPTSPLPQTPQ